MQTLILSALIFCYFVMSFLTAEAKPHFTNFLMSNGIQSKHFSRWEGNNEIFDKILAKSHSKPVTEVNSQHDFTWQDFPKGIQLAKKKYNHL